MLPLKAWAPFQSCALEMVCSPLLTVRMHAPTHVPTARQHPTPGVFEEKRGVLVSLPVSVTKHPDKRYVNEPRVSWTQSEGPFHKGREVLAAGTELGVGQLSMLQLQSVNG